MPHGGINRGGGELLLPPSNTRTTVAGAALAATGAVPKVYTAVAGASYSGPPSLITDIHEGLRASDFQPMDTDFAEGRRPMGLQMGKTLDDRNAAWWAERKFQEPAYLENLRQQKLDVAAFHEERRAKEYAETTAEYKEYVKKALAEVAPAEAGCSGTRDGDAPGRGGDQTRGRHSCILFHGVVQCGRRVPHGVRDESVGRAGVALDGHTDGTTG
jgi:hypothetical protein